MSILTAEQCTDALMEAETAVHAGAIRELTYDTIAKALQHACGELAANDTLLNRCRDLERELEEVRGQRDLFQERLQKAPTRRQLDDSRRLLACLLEVGAPGEHRCHGIARDDCYAVLGSRHSDADVS